MSAGYSILSLLPHRPPMLMVDGIRGLAEDSCTAYKHISWSEPCFHGHFPGNPIFPGVLIIEALAQCCAIWLNRDGSGKLPVFAGIASARFRRKVQPGDTLELSVRFLSEKKGFYTFRTLAEVDGQPACEAELVVCYRES